MTQKQAKSPTPKIKVDENNPDAEMSRDDLETILKLLIEKDNRCGDGSGRGVYTHSTNCDCERIDAQIREIEVSNGIEPSV